MTNPPPETPSAIGRRHALLGARARRLARPRIEPPAIASISCLVCEAGGSLYGIPLHRTSRVAAFHRASYAPASHPALIGVLGRSGVFYHVFDLARLVGSGSGRDGGHVVLMRGGPPAIAFRVDEAVRVAALVELAPDATSQMRSAHPAVRSFARPLEATLFEGRAISLLDVDQLTSTASHGRDEGDLSVDQ